MIWFLVEHPVTSIFMFFSKISGRKIRHFQGRLHMVHLQSTFFQREIVGLRLLFSIIVKTITFIVQDVFIIILVSSVLKVNALYEYL